jgi:hypothetical protein
MKVTIIGSNTQAANFINNCEIINDYMKADVVIFSGNVNWRSAVQKLNKIDKNKLVIVMDTNFDLFAKKYNGLAANYDLLRPEQTQPVILLKSNILDECVVRTHQLVAFKSGRKYIVLEPCLLKVKTPVNSFISEYLAKNKCTLVTVAEQENLPKCMFIQVDLNMFPKSNISKYVNEIICDYMNTQ